MRVIDTIAIPTLALTIAGLVGGLTACGTKDDKKQSNSGEEQNVEVTEEEGLDPGDSSGLIGDDETAAVNPPQSAARDQCRRHGAVGAGRVAGVGRVGEVLGVSTRDAGRSPDGVLAPCGSLFAGARETVFQQYRVVEERVATVR